MNPARWRRAKQLFELALALSDEDRNVWLATNADDEGLRWMVQRMLEADRCQRPDPPPATSLLEDGLDAWASGQRVGTYQIERRLGRGGMGEVYLARRDDGTVQHRVAIKRLRQDASHPELLRRFLAERRILARLEHPNIARFLDAGADADGRPYAVMEYVDGVPITDHVTARGLDIEACLKLFIKVVDAVCHAHSQLVVHRDIKPGNVLVDAQGDPHLLDFGIAKPLQDLDESMRADQHTSFELRCFSLRHAAPEQLRPGPVSTACDIYGLGALLYELLAGSPPLNLEGLSYGEAERIVIERQPRPPSRVLAAAGQRGRARRVRGDLDRIILHALEKDPRHRYPSAEALAADLRRVSELRPISLRRTHRRYRLWRFARRNWLAVGLASTAILAVLVGAFLIAMQARALAERHEIALSAQRHSEAIANLLLDAFDGADPTRSRGEHVSAREVLEIAALRLSNRSDLDPRSAIELNSRLSEVLLVVADHDGAEAAAQRAIGYVDHTISSELAVKAQLALARTGLARLDLATAENALAVAESHLASARPFEEADQRAETHARIGLLRVSLLVSGGKQMDAQVLAGEVHEAARSLLGDGHAVVHEAAATLAERRSSIGLMDDAASLANSVLPKIHSPELDPNGRRLLSVLARVMHEQARYDDAFAVLQRLLQGAGKLYGTAHPAYARNLTANAVGADRVGRGDLAETYFSAAIDLMESFSHDGAQPALALTLNNFAAFLIRRDGSSEQAEAASRRAVSLIDASLPQGHPNRGFLRLSLGTIQYLNGRHEEAVTTLETALRLFDQLAVGSTTALPRTQALTRLAAAQLALGRTGLALGSFQQALAIRNDVPDTHTLDEVTIQLMTEIGRQLGLPVTPEVRQADLKGES